MGLYRVVGFGFLDIGLRVREPLAVNKSMLSDSILVLY